MFNLPNIESHSFCAAEMRRIFFMVEFSTLIAPSELEAQISLRCWLLKSEAQRSGFFPRYPIFRRDSEHFLLWCVRCVSVALDTQFLQPWHLCVHALSIPLYWESRRTERGGHIFRGFSSSRSAVRGRTGYEEYRRNTQCRPFLLPTLAVINPMSHCPFAIRIVLRKSKWRRSNNSCYSFGQGTPNSQLVSYKKLHREVKVYLGKGERALKRCWCRLVVAWGSPRLSLSRLRGIGSHPQEVEQHGLPSSFLGDCPTFLCAAGVGSAWQSSDYTAQSEGACAGDMLLSRNEGVGGFPLRS